MRAGIVLFSAAALLGSAGLAHAAEPGTAKLTPKAAAAVKKYKAEKGKKKILITSGLKAAKDGNGGDLRAPSAEEDAALATRAAATTTLRVNRDGSLTGVLGEEFMSDLVVTRNADGTLSTTCGQTGHVHGDAKPALEVK
jgi:hypothetical protein